MKHTEQAATKQAEQRVLLHCLNARCGLVCCLEDGAAHETCPFCASACERIEALASSPRKRDEVWHPCDAERASRIALNEDDRKGGTP